MEEILFHHQPSNVDFLTEVHQRGVHFTLRLGRILIALTKRGRIKVRNGRICQLLHRTSVRVEPKLLPMNGWWHSGSGEGRVARG